MESSSCSLIHFTILTSLFVVGCNQETSDPNSEECTPIPGVEDCNQGGETGGAETGGNEEGGGGGTGGEPQPLAEGECQHNNDESVVGWRWQCEGELFASIEFDAPLNKSCDDILGDRCSEHHRFGPSNDTYEAPDVMACCGEYDAAYKDTYLEFCNYDLAQQVCVSMAKRLEKLVKDGSFGVYVGQGAALQQWVAENYTTCFAALVQNDSDPDPGVLVSFWDVPNDPKWSDLSNFVISIDTGTESTGVFQPTDPAEWLPCNGATDNNDEVFEGDPAPGTGTVFGVDLMNTVTGTLTGPVILGGPVTAPATFSASCAFKGCSAAEFWIDSGETVVEDIVLYTDGFTASNGNGSSMVVDSARVSLYDTVPMQPIYDPAGLFLGYQVTAGSAFFLLSGTSDGVFDHYLATNSTDMLITESRGVWEIETFDIEYVDQSSYTWTLSIPATRWD